jgi:hypothetical protein
MAGVVPDDEPIANILQRRERELVQRIYAIKEMLLPAERELADVRKAMSALQIPHDEPPALSVFGSALAGNYGSAFSPFLKQSTENALTGVVLEAPQGALQTQADLTIKQMILNALRDHFIDGGATPTELSDYFRTSYGKTVHRNSISPQLARLREEGSVEQPPGLLNEGKWKITRAGKWYGVPLPLRGE